MTTFSRLLSWCYPLFLPLLFKCLSLFIWRWEIRVCVDWWVCTLWYTYGGQKSTCWSRLSLSTIWVSGIWLRVLDWQHIALPTEPSLWLIWQAILGNITSHMWLFYWFYIFWTFPFNLRAISRHIRFYRNVE